MKKLFKENGIPFKAIELDNMDGGAELQDALIDKTNQRTVPNVFIGREHIGGSDDTLKLHKSGDLMRKLAKLRATSESKKNSEQDTDRQEL